MGHGAWGREGARKGRRASRGPRAWQHVPTVVVKPFHAWFRSNPFLPKPWIRKRHSGVRHLARASAGGMRPPAPGLQCCGRSHARGWHGRGHPGFQRGAHSLAHGSGTWESASKVWVAVRRVAHGRAPMNEPLAVLQSRAKRDRCCDARAPATAAGGCSSRAGAKAYLGWVGPAPARCQRQQVKGSAWPRRNALAGRGSCAPGAAGKRWGGYFPAAGRRRPLSFDVRDCRVRLGPVAESKNHTHSFVWPE